MTIRPFHPDDLPRLKEITVEAFDGVSIDQAIEREFGLINGRDWQFRKGRHIDDDVRRNAEGIYVLDIDGEIAGLITTYADRDAGIGFIPNLSIVPEHRGAGWGRRLIQYALDRFCDAGLTHARIETLAQNEVGSHLYRAIGFREVSRQVHFCMDLTHQDSGD
ncbi:MAG: GNAT family N-acetyltransferase [Planctomycetaceae bacterium]